MLEALHEWEESVDEDRQLERERSFTISPGFRKAFNFPDAQVVLALGAPIRFSKDAPTEYGALLYLSFEHKFTK